jgi:Transposase
MLFIGDDWAEAHHDIEIEDEAGRLLVRKRLPEGLAGVTLLHELIAEHLDPSGEPDQVLVGIETDRGPWVQALLATGYLVYAINPLQVARYRERHSTSGAKSDPGDAHLLAEIVRLDRAHHRRIAGDSEIAEHVKVAARAHQTMIWSRVRHVNTLRSLLREYYPAALAVFGTDLASPDALGSAYDPRAGPPVVPGQDRNAAPQSGPATQHRRDCREDQDRAGLRPADRPAGSGPRLCRQRLGIGGRVDHHGHPD